MFIGCLIIVIFGVVQALSFSLAQFMFARFMLGFGNALVIVAAPVYVMEIAHPAYRGVMVGIFNAFATVGGTPAVYIPLATSTIIGTASWRIPLWCQVIFPGIVLLTAPFLPESPRWLIANNRPNEALAIMVSLSLQHFNSTR